MKKSAGRLFQPTFCLAKMPATLKDIPFLILFAEVAEPGLTRQWFLAPCQQ